jgi:isopentenyldiphosphate isomerase
VTVELIDVLTAEGAPTGVRKSKAQIHRDGDWHRAIHVWIRTSDGRILLQKRSMRKENNPGLWDVSAAGHVSAGEDLLECAIREVREELGLSLQRSDFRHVATIPASCVLNDGTYFDNEFHEVFLVTCDVDRARLVLQPEEVDDAKLVTRDEFRALISTLVPHGEEYELILRLL